MANILRQARLESMRKRKKMMKAQLKRAKHQLQSEIMQSRLRKKGDY